MNANEKEAFRQMNFKQKLSHIFYYYKWHIIIAAALLIFVTSLIHGIVTEKKVIFEAVVVNSNVTAMDDPPLMSDFADTQKDYDPEKEEMKVEYLYLDLERQDQTALATQQKLLAMIAAEELDCMIAPKTIIDKYTSLGAFTDLTEIIPEDKLKELEEKGLKPYYAEYKSEETNSITHVLAGMEIIDSPVIKKGFSSDSATFTPYYDKSPSSAPVYAVIINSANKNRAVDFLFHLAAR